MLNNYNNAYIKKPINYKASSIIFLHLFLFLNIKSIK